MTLLILADDLTGAADSAARCHHAGLAAHVALRVAAGPLPVGALAFTTDSRYLTAAAAAEQVRYVLTMFSGPQAAHLPINQESPTNQWYKKIDSTLRGNIGAELDAMLEILTPPGAQPCAVICPAFPAQGRGLVDGYLVYAQAAARPLHLPTILSSQTTRPVRLIPLAAVRAGVTQLTATLLHAQRQGTQIFVIDALRDDDLTTLLAAAQSVLAHALFCGSAGLIEPLARTYARQTPAAQANPQASVQVRKPILAVIGSGSDMAHRQLAALRQREQARCVELQPDLSSTMTLRDLTTPLTDWVIHLPQPAEQTPLEGPAARAFVDRLTQVAIDWIQWLQPQTLLIVGGDTTVYLLRALGIQQLTIVSELMPGIPLSVGRDARGHPWHIITKAGNFGDEATLVHLFQDAE